MSSPFISAEPVTFEKPIETPKVTLPSELHSIIKKYESVIEKPDNINILWDFVQVYLTFLETKTNLIVPLLSESNNNNLMLVIKDVSIKDIPWSVYNLFLTLSNIGTEIAKKETKNDKDKFYLMYVMLSINNDSPTYSFTELLQSLQQNSSETQAVYNELNNKFLEAFKQYNPVNNSKNNQVVPTKEIDFFSRTVTVPYLKQEICYKTIFIILFVILVLLLLLTGGYFYKNPGVVVIGDSSSISGSIGSIDEF